MVSRQQLRQGKRNILIFCRNLLEMHHQKPGKATSKQYFFNYNKRNNDQIYCNCFIVNISNNASKAEGQKFNVLKKDKKKMEAELEKNVKFFRKECKKVSYTIELTKV